MLPRICAWLLVALLLGGPPAACAATQAYSKDGEATVYLTGDFRGAFDLMFEAALAPQKQNRSWSMLGILILGQMVPSDSIEVGLFRNAASSDAATAFTYISRPGPQEGFKSLGACAEPCRIELRGHSNDIEALINGRAVGRWQRSAFGNELSTVQLNAEVSRVGDSMSGRLTPLWMRATNRVLKDSTCAFTTQGVEARALSNGALAFGGTFSIGARVSYVLLPQGTPLARCP